MGTTFHNSYTTKKQQIAELAKKQRPKTINKTRKEKRKKHTQTSPFAGSNVTVLPGKSGVPR